MESLRLPIPSSKSHVPSNPTETAALTTLRHVLRDPLADWSCDGQRLAVLATLEGQRDVISVLATGAGKTMQVILAVMLDPSHSNVVIVPLKSLMQDYERRLRQINIPYAVWSTKGEEHMPIVTHSNLILVMIDQVHKQTFRTALTQYHDTSGRPVTRFFFDEVHYAQTASDYRPSFHNLDELRSLLPVQFVLMSGTIAPRSMPALRQTFDVMSNAIEIRTQTVRPELQYIVDPPLKTRVDILQRLEKYINTYTTQFDSQDRGLIFCETKAMLEEIKERFHIPGYQGGSSANMMDRARMQAEREQAYHSWIGGTPSAWMVCTSAFAAGSDWPHVRVVIIAGTPNRIVDTEQEFGRGGRDKRHAIAVIIPYKHWPAPKDPNAVYTGVKEMQELVYGSSSPPSHGTPTCVRYLLTSFNDGVGLRCSDIPHQQLCSRCQPVPQNVVPPLTGEVYSYKAALIPVSTPTSKRAHDAADDAATANIAHAHQVSKRRKAEREMKYFDECKSLENILRMFTGQCPVCFYHRGPSGNIHELKQCPELTRSGFGEYVDWKKKVRYEVSTGQRREFSNTCFKCGVPQLHDLHDTFVNSASQCQYADIIMPLIWCIQSSLEKGYMDEQLKEMGHKFKQQWKSTDEFRTWLGQHHRPPFCNSVWLFIEYMLSDTPSDW